MVKWLAPGAAVVALVKPQFEAGKNQVGKGGVVRDPTVHRQVLEAAIADAAGSGLSAIDLTLSPITGPAGNHEFLLRLGYQVTQAALEIETAIDRCLLLIGASSE